MLQQTATFAAGCFWGVQYYFDQVPGVNASIVGYTGGHVENPTYEMVCTHKTGHAEAVQLTFDSSAISYEELTRHFFRLHDPTQLNRQGPDIGDSYRSAIFYYDKTQKQVAVNLKSSLSKDYEKPIATQIVQATEFYPAEPYHQRYAERTGRGICHVPYQPLN